MRPLVETIITHENGVMPYSDAQLDEFRKLGGKPVWDQWVAENKDKFDAQGLLDMIFAEAKAAAK